MAVLSIWVLSVCLEAAPLGETQHYRRLASGNAASRGRDGICP